MFLSLCLCFQNDERLYKPNKLVSKTPNLKGTFYTSKSKRMVTLTMFIYKITEIQIHPITMQHLAQSIKTVNKGLYTFLSTNFSKKWFLSGAKNSLQFHFRLLYACYGDLKRSAKSKKLFEKHPREFFGRNSHLNPK